MSIISLLIVLILIGVLLYVVETMLPIDPTIKKIIRIVVVLFVILWLLSAFGVLDSLNVPIPRFHR